MAYYSKKDAPLTDRSDGVDLLGARGLFAAPVRVARQENGDGDDPAPANGAGRRVLHDVDLDVLARLSRVLGRLHDVLLRLRTRTRRCRCTASRRSATPWATSSASFEDAGAATEPSRRTFTNRERTASRRVAYRRVARSRGGVIYRTPPGAAGGVTYRRLVEKTPLVKCWWRRGGAPKRLPCSPRRLQASRRDQASPPRFGVGARAPPWPPCTSVRQCPRARCPPARATRAAPGRRRRRVRRRGRADHSPAVNGGGGVVGRPDPERGRDKADAIHDAPHPGARGKPLPGRTDRGGEHALDAPQQGDKRACSDKPVVEQAATLEGASLPC